MFNTNNNDGENQQVAHDQFGRTGSMALKWSLVFGIAILLNLFVNYSLSLVYKEPSFTQFCPIEQVQKPITGKESCVERGGQWTEYTGVESGAGQAVYDGSTVVRGGSVPTKVQSVQQGEQKIIGYCDPYFTCSQKHYEASKVYNRNVFVTLAIFGVLLLIASFFVVVSPALSIGLSFGGVLSLIVASLRYWSDMNDYLRVAVLGLALAALIAFAIKKVRV